MKDQTNQFVPIAITAFIPWLLSLASMGAAAALPEIFFLLLQYILMILLFAIAFAMYFRLNHQTDAFEVTITAMFCVFFYEFVYWTFIHTGDIRVFSYFHWIVPMFFTATTIYVVGRYAN